LSNPLKVVVLSVIIDTHLSYQNSKLIKF